MAYDMFLQIQGIKGDSSDAKHKEQSEVISYHHNIMQARGGALSAEGVHTGSRAEHDDFVITKRLDSASPTLSIYCCDGKHIPYIKLELCRAMGEKTVFMTYEFKDGIVASISTLGSGDEDDPIPIEEISFRYGQIEWAYTPTDITGGGKSRAAIRSGWSTMENVRV